MRRFGYWPPWRCTDWALFKVWRGFDECDRAAISVKVPFLGAFHWWYGAPS